MRFPRKPFVIFYDNADQLRRLPARDRTRGRLPAAAAWREEGRPRVAVHAEQPAIHDRLLRHPARRRGGGADQSDEPDAGARALRARQRRPRRLRRTGAAAAHRAAARRGPRAHRGGHLQRLPAPSPPTSRARVRGRAACTAESPGPGRVGRHAGGRPGTARHRGRPRRPRRDALHLGHHRPSERLHAHAPQRDVQRRRLLGHCQPGQCRAGGVAAVPRDRHADQHERRHLQRRHRGAAAALGPRRRGAVRAAPSRQRAGADHRDGDRLHGQPEAEPVRPVERAPHRRRRRRDAQGGGVGDGEEVQPQVHRGLRHVGDDGRHARQPARSPEGAVPRHSAVRRRLAHHRPRHAARAAAGPDRRDHRARSAGDARVLEPAAGHRRGVSRDRRQIASCAPATSATSTTRATTSSSIA